MNTGQFAQIAAIALMTVAMALGLVYGACRAVYGAAHHAEEAAGRRRRRRAVRIERRNACSELAHVQHLTQPPSPPPPPAARASEAFGTAGRPQTLPHRDPRHPQHGSMPPPPRRVPRTPTRIELDGVLFEAHQILEDENGQEGQERDG